MGHMKKYKCPVCHSTKDVVSYGRRKQVLRYLCKSCSKHFSVNPCFLNSKTILTDHLDGLSFRKLARKYGVSPMKAWRVVKTELKKLPQNNQFTFNYCNQFSSTFVFDGKYFNVKGYRDWVLLWGVDYFRHDIPIVLVAPSESYQAWAKFFFYFRIVNHHPQLLVCDDNTNLKLAALKNFPSVRIQTCTNHFKENVRRNLKVRSDNTYKQFMRRVEQVFKAKLSDEAMNKKLYAMFREYRDDPVTLDTLTTIAKYRSELTGYRGIKGAPMTTNIIEGLNAHLESRLVGIRSFQSPLHAKLWLNGYVLKRRLTTLTDCRGKFKHLNGKNMVQQTQKPGIDLPILF